MGFQFFSGRSSGFLVRCVVVVSIAPFMVACAKSGFQSKQVRSVTPPTAAELQKILPDAEMEQGWELKFEEIIKRYGLVADRYEWQAPVRGSYYGSRNGRSFSYQTGWYGCGWAYYANPPGGVVGHAARIAAKFDDGILTPTISMNDRALAVCRHAPTLLPTNVPLAGEEGAISASERRKSNKSVTKFIGKSEKIQFVEDSKVVSTRAR
ncbi:MAG: hypothetical protein KUG59_03995 [Parvibaculaceae bacterium]|nr:hypothetical protein [Parvibaculaceae bacterium]